MEVQRVDDLRANSISPISCTQCTFARHSPCILTARTHRAHSRDLGPPLKALAPGLLRALLALDRHAVVAKCCIELHVDREIKASAPARCRHTHASTICTTRAPDAQRATLESGSLLYGT